MDMFFVLRLSNDPGKFVVLPKHTSDAPSRFIPSEMEFRGAEQHVRAFLAEKGHFPLQIQEMMDNADNAPELNAPEYIPTYMARVL